VLVGYPRKWSGRLRVADTVREFRGEAVVLMPSSFEAAAAALYWRGRRRIGYATDTRGWLLTDALPLPSPRLHQVDEYLRLVARLGADTAQREPRLTAPKPDADSRRRARDLLRECCAGEDRRSGRAGGPGRARPPGQPVRGDGVAVGEDDVPPIYRPVTTGPLLP